MDTKLSTQLIQHLEQNWRFWLGIVYFTVLIFVAVSVFRKQNPPPVPAALPPVVVAEPKVDLDPLTRRIEQLELDLERQTKANQALTAQLDQHERANQRTERRLQAHTEAFKRICEYVMVITIDKKLVPRQCLPEYRWSREEGA